MYNVWGVWPNIGFEKCKHILEKSSGLKMVKLYGLRMGCLWISCACKVRRLNTLGTIMYGLYLHFFKNLVWLGRHNGILNDDTYFIDRHILLQVHRERTIGKSISESKLCRYLKYK